MVWVVCLYPLDELSQKRQATTVKNDQKRKREKNTITNPCFKCERRHTRCHADCSAYAAYCAEKEEENKRRKAVLHAEDDFLKARKRARQGGECWEDAKKRVHASNRRWQKPQKEN